METINLIKSHGKIIILANRTLSCTKSYWEGKAGVDKHKESVV